MPPPTSPFATITFGQAKAELLLRLNSTGADFWDQGEVGTYLVEAMSVYNALTQTFVQDWTKTFTSADLPWQSLANGTNVLVGNNPTSPRYQTINSISLYQLIQNHLLEPATGGTWTGTPQFTIDDLTQALQRRRDQILQATGTQIGPFSATFSIPAGQTRAYLTDAPSGSVLDVVRVRYVPSAGNGSPSTLYREDGLAYEYFENDFTTISSQTPMAWDVLAGPPLALTLDVPAPTANTLDVLAILSGDIITDPTIPELLLLPNDWFWVLKFGILSDLLRKDAEATDLERADYCEARFRQGLEAMKTLPWLLQARINNLPVDTPSVAEMDTFAYEWQSDPTAPAAIVRGGVDLFAISPSVPAATNVAVTLSVVANMPIPQSDAEFIQIPRDVLDAVLDEAQHLAMFKCGGFEFAESTRTLHKSFISMCVETNSRLRESGIFSSTLRPMGYSKQDSAQPRFALSGGAA